jgi:transcriptional regulator with XRE-family HTH domain
MRHDVKKLKDYMKRRGMSYSEFATEIGINPTTVFRYVRGELNIPGPVMYIIVNDLHRCKCGGSGVE